MPVYKTPSYKAPIKKSTAHKAPVIDVPKFKRPATKTDVLDTLKIEPKVEHKTEHKFTPTTSTQKMTHHEPHETESESDEEPEKPSVVQEKRFVIVKPEGAKHHHHYDPRLYPFLGISFFDDPPEFVQTEHPFTHK